METLVLRVSRVFEREVGVRFRLVFGQDLLLQFEQGELPNNNHAAFASRGEVCFLYNFL